MFVVALAAFSPVGAYASNRWTSMSVTIPNSLCQLMSGTLWLSRYDSPRAPDRLWLEPDRLQEALVERQVLAASQQHVLGNDGARSRNTQSCCHLCCAEAIRHGNHRTARQNHAKVGYHT
eukprot:scaffold845_cov364-Prasinococcus_capsulatus_cf.AAC.19